MTWMLKLYALALKLYPRPFRERFAPEMEDVFRSGLEDAEAQRTVLTFGLREALRLPGSLFDVYAWSMQAGGGRKMAISSTGGGGTFGDSLPGEGWGAAFLAGLPNLLVGMLMVSSTLMGLIQGIDQVLFGYLLLVVVAVLLLGGLWYGFTRGWRRWSASWLVYLYIFGMALLSMAVNALPSRFTGGEQVLNLIQLFAIPLLLAYLIYKITAADRVRGLLAALPPMALLWGVYFEEFVPVLPKALAWAWITLLAFGASALILRARRFSTALGLAVLVPLLGGLPFAYLGVYMGGTLPFSEPGPSLLEVARQYLPFLAAVLTFALGPQLAVKLRAVGRKSRAAGGSLFYRLALAGILLGLVAALLRFTDELSDSPRWISELLAIWPLWIGLPVLLYLAGFLGLGLAARHPGALPAAGHPVRALAALFILLAGVPLVLYLGVSITMTHRGPDVWPFFVAALAWALAAAWAVFDQPPTEASERAAS